MPYRKAKAALVLAAAALWAGDGTLGALGAHDTLRSISQGAAVTVTVLAGMAWMYRGPARVTTSGRATYVSTNALRDAGPITVEFRKAAPTIPAQSTGGTGLPSILMGQLYRLGAADADNRRHRP